MNISWVLLQMRKPAQNSSGFPLAQAKTSPWRRRKVELLGSKRHVAVSGLFVHRLDGAFPLNKTHSLPKDLVAKIMSHPLRLKPEASRCPMSLCLPADCSDHLNLSLAKQHPTPSKRSCEALARTTPTMMSAESPVFFWFHQPRCISSYTSLSINGGGRSRSNGTPDGGRVHELSGTQVAIWGSNWNQNWINKQL